MVVTKTIDQMAHQIAIAKENDEYIKTMKNLPKQDKNSISLTATDPDFLELLSASARRIVTFGLLLPA